MLLIAAISAAAALYGTIAGLGGGIFIVPALLVTGASLAVAAPLSLGAVFIGAIAGLLPRGRWRLVHRASFRALLPMSLVGSATGGAAAQHLPEAPLLLLFAGVAGGVAVEAVRASRSGHVVATTAAQPTVLRVGGGAAGFLSGALGIGGGVLIVPLARRFGPMRLEQATATSVAVIICSSAVGITANLLAARGAGAAALNLADIGAATFGAAIGGAAGGRFSPQIGERARALLVAAAAAAAAAVALERLIGG
jgi:hypothetical protein